MTTRTVERSDEWEAVSYAGGYGGLQRLADDEFSGKVIAGSARLFMTRGSVVGVLGGSIEDFEGADGTAREAPHPALPLLAVMQERSEEVRAKYYSEDTPLSEVDRTLSDGNFTGYIELSENVLSGDYYQVYHQGRSMSVAWVGASERLISDDEAFEQADDEVGIFEVRPAEIEIVDVPEPTGGSAGGTESGFVEDAEDSAGASAGGVAGGAGTAATDASDGESSADASARDASASDTATDPSATDTSATDASATDASASDAATDESTASGAGPDETASTGPAGSEPTESVDAAGGPDSTGTGRRASGADGQPTERGRESAGSAGRDRADPSGSQPDAPESGRSPGREERTETSRQAGGGDRGRSDADASPQDASESAERERDADASASGDEPERAPPEGDQRSGAGTSPARDGPGPGGAGRGDASAESGRQQDARVGDQQDARAGNQQDARGGDQQDARAGDQQNARAGGQQDGRVGGQQDERAGRQRSPDPGRSERRTGDRGGQAGSGGEVAAGDLETRSLPSLDPGRTASASRQARKRNDSTGLAGGNGRGAAAQGEASQGGARQDRGDKGTARADDAEESPHPGAPADAESGARDAEAAQGAGQREPARGSEQASDRSPDQGETPRESGEAAGGDQTAGADAERAPDADTGRGATGDTGGPAGADAGDAAEPPTEAGQAGDRQAEPADADSADAASDRATAQAAEDDRQAETASTADAGGGTADAGTGPADAPEEDTAAAVEAQVEEVEALQSDLQNMEGERDDLASERDSLESELEEAKSELERLRGRLNEAVGGAADAEIQVSPQEAIEETSLFVRYGSKGEATLENAHAGDAAKAAVDENLRLRYHTTFEAENAAVDGQPFDDYIRNTLEYRFANWLVRELLYEIRDTGHESEMADLFDALPQIDRIELGGVVSVTYTQNGEEHRAQEGFDLVANDRTGNPLVVTNLIESRQPTGEEPMKQLVTGAERVGESNQSLAAAFQVTTSYFDSPAVGVVQGATSGGLLSRDKRRSFVNLSRKDGYHLCLLEARQDFDMVVPDL